MWANLDLPENKVLITLMVFPIYLLQYFGSDNFKLFLVFYF